MPFFLYYPMMLTHAPYDATPDSPDYLQSVSGKNQKPLGHFPDMVAYTDKLIGKVVAKLEELHLRDNTLLLVLGDNGTGRGTPSKFKGRDVLGGKGTTTEWGTHVPLIGNWPGHFASGKVYLDLIDATDLLPTICAATGTPIPADLKPDGLSFLPQLRGEKGDPRPWLYAWYNPSGGAQAKAEFAHDAQFKLYSDGRFYAVNKDDLEKSPLTGGNLDADAQAAKVKLQAALRQFQGPRADYFVKQSQSFGGERGEDAEGNKATKSQKKAARLRAAEGQPAATPQQGNDRGARFDSRDLNHDGKLSWEEFLATASNKDTARARFEKADTNHDGFLSREEFENMRGNKP